MDARAKFYLELIIQRLGLGHHQYVKGSEFGNYVIQNQIVEPNGSYDVEKIQAALQTLFLGADQKVYDLALTK